MPRTEANLVRLKKDAVFEAVYATRVIIFTVLADKRGFTVEDLRDTWNQVDKLSDSICEGRVSMTDLKNVLRDEYGCVMPRN